MLASAWHIRATTVICIGLSLPCWGEMNRLEPDPGIGWVGHDLKSRLAESFVEAGKDVAVVTFGAHFVFPALDQYVSLKQLIDASNYHHGRRSISSSNQSKTTSTGIKLSVTQQTIPARAAIR